MQKFTERNTKYKKESITSYDVYIFVYYCYFFGFVGRSWSFLGSVPTQVSSIFPRLSRFFCRGFSWPPSVSCRYVSKTPLIFLDVCILHGSVF